MAKRLIPLKKLEDYTPAEARVLVAKDVLKAIKAEEFVATCGTYVSLFNNIPAAAKPGDDVRELVGRKPCQLCAVGAAALAFVRRFDGVKLEESACYPGERAELSAHTIASKLFPSPMRNMMEAAFEIDACFAVSYAGSEEAYRAEDFGVQYDDENSRLKAIFQNIIDNDGEFVP